MCFQPVILFCYKIIHNFTESKLRMDKNINELKLFKYHNSKNYLILTVEVDVLSKL